jgi:phospholipid-transporting ATPase
MGIKQIDYNTFLEWHSRFKDAMIINNPDEKAELLKSLYQELEKNFKLAGVSSIEDKLQEGVPETIELLIKSGIRVWVLTGDKKETALIIGRTCRLIEEIGRNDIDLAIKDSEHLLEEKLDDLIKTFHLKHIKSFDEIMKIQLDEKYYMIVDGNNLIHILKNPNLSTKFFKIGLLCRSVICCRVSPIQKSQIVSLTKNYGNWITLAIGDGANDVPMIMEAHIGVGIQGKEGTQAVRSADYALCQFKFLQRLILIHGRNGYRRISTFICYYFYKNIILVFAEVYFVFFSGYSGQLFFPDTLDVFYNALWTSWPCIFAFSVEKDIIQDSPSQISIRTNKNNLLGKHFEIIPLFYQAGQKGIYFNLKLFWRWLLFAIIHGGICYISVEIGLRYQSIFNNGKLIDHWWCTTVIFTLIIHVVSYKLFIELSYWNSLVVFSTLFSIFFYYICILIINLPVFSRLIQAELNLKVISMFQTGTFWLYIITVPLICVLNDLSLKFIKKFSDPSPVDIFNSDAFKKEGDLTNIIKRLSNILNPKEVYMQKRNSHRSKNKMMLSFFSNKLNTNPTGDSKELELRYN